MDIPHLRQTSGRSVISEKHILLVIHLEHLPPQTIHYWKVISQRQLNQVHCSRFSKYLMKERFSKPMVLDKLYLTSTGFFDVFPSLYFRSFPYDGVIAQRFTFWWARKNLKVLIFTPLIHWFLSNIISRTILLHTLRFGANLQSIQNQLSQTSPGSFGLS